MKSSLLKSLCLLFLLTLLPLFAQETAEPPQEPPQEAAEQPQFNFHADWTRYRAADSLIYLEYTASLGRAVLTYKTEDDKTFAEFLVEAKISNQDSVVKERKWRSRDVVPDQSEATMNMIIPIINSFIVGPGDYTLEIKITDLFGDEDRIQRVRFPVTLHGYSGDLTLSDIQLASSITSDASENPFVKNGYKVMPNPSNLYGIGLPILYCYMEIYNLTPGTSDRGKQYTVEYSITDDSGNEIKSFPDQQRVKPGTSSVAVNNLNVVTLVSGTYNLHVTVTDLETDESATTDRKFFVYRQEDFAQGSASFQKVKVESGQGSPGLDASRYDSMTEDELDLEFDMANYIADREEARTWKKLNMEGKREFIKEFWAKRDETPGTPANEFKQEYLGRAQLANNMYRGTFTEGYKSDRGRILLVYGKPDEIERYPSSSDTREYHIWHYYSIQGGVYFVFADKRSMSDLELVHSTARGELYDPDWTRWVQTNY